MAFHYYSSAIQLQPLNATAHTSRAKVSLEMGHWSSALQDCNEALKIQPNNNWAYFWRSRAYQGLGDLQVTLE
jgi:tetratricopeptide (TPR) repeat protein